MRRCKVAVIGLGIMGSAALYNLRRNGVDAWGFDPLAVGEKRGSSHGSTRVYRRFNFEPGYERLSEHAFQAWRRLEQTTGQTVLIECEVVEAGPQGSTIVRQSREAPGRTAAPLLKGRDVNDRYPAFSLPDDWEAVIQNGGILHAEKAHRSYRDCVTDRIIDRRVRSFDRDGNGLIITDEDGRAYGAERIIVSTGPWIRELVQGFDGADVTTTRQAVGWYQPGDHAKVRHGRFPIFILDCPEGLIYGSPYAENEGLKAANHRHGPRQDAAALVQNATADDLTEVTAALAKYLRVVDPGTPTRQDFCLYTNTADQQFIVDWLPVSPGADPDVIVVSPCSGHGFKFASAIGETVAEMAEYGTCCPDGAFRISRFASFQKLA